METEQILPIVRTPIQIRFSDTDQFGHINNVAYAAFTEVGRADFFRSVEGKKPWFVLARLDLQFRNEARFDDTLVMETSTVSIGTTSMTLRHTLYRGEDMISDCTATLVTIDMETKRPINAPTLWTVDEEMAPRIVNS